LRGEHKVFSSFLSLASLCEAKLFKGNKRERERVVVLDISSDPKEGSYSRLKVFFFLILYLCLQA
jgi:hypothetical protein